VTLNILVSIPAKDNTALSHLERVADEITLYGLPYETKTCEELSWQ